MKVRPSDALHLMGRDPPHVGDIFDEPPPVGTRFSFSQSERKRERAVPRVKGLGLDLVLRALQLHLVHPFVLNPRDLFANGSLDARMRNARPQHSRDLEKPGVPKVRCERPHADGQLPIHKPLIEARRHPSGQKTR